jgi:hypothetical protein
MMDGTGAFVLGRTTFDVGIGTWGADGAFGTECFVVTHPGRTKSSNAGRPASRS